MHKWGRRGEIQTGTDSERSVSTRSLPIRLTSSSPHRTSCMTQMGTGRLAARTHYSSDKLQTIRNSAQCGNGRQPSTTMLEAKPRRQRSLTPAAESSWSPHPCGASEHNTQATASHEATAGIGDGVTHKARLVLSLCTCREGCDTGLIGR